MRRQGTANPIEKTNPAPGSDGILGSKLHIPTGLYPNLPKSTGFLTRNTIGDMMINARIQIMQQYKIILQGVKKLFTSWGDLYRSLIIPFSLKKT